MRQRDDGQGVSDPALEKTVSAEEAGVTPGGASGDGGRLTAGAKLGRYEIVEFIGGGGMGWVYRAKDTELEREVAIKVVQPTVAGPKGRDRLLAEARAMAKLRHRAVVPVFDVGEYAGGVYVAMALVKGGTLHDWMHAEPRPWRQVVARFLEAGRGLVAAHAAGIVHRDFKPRNVLVGDGGEVMVADFGIASASVEAGDDGATGSAREATSIVGTPAYMAPEQAAGQTVDARADQYSFCVSLWEGLHGQRPQEAETRTQGALASATEAPKSRRRVPGWLTDAVARGFAPAPEKRWPTLAAMLDRLERGLARRRRGLAAAGAACVGVAALTIFMAKRSGAQNPCPPPDELEFGVEHRAEIERAFRATGAAGVEDVLGRVIPPLSDYVASWRARMVQSCRATHVSRTQSAELLDRRTMCLASRRAHVTGLLDTFTRADRRVVANAVGAVDALPSLGPCDRTDSLRAQPPRSRGVEVAVEGIEASLAKGRDLRQRGRFREALGVFESATAAARAVAWSPVLAEALAELVQLRGQLFMDSKALVEELANAAAQAKDDERTLVALVGLAVEEVQRGSLERAAALEPILTSTMLRVEGAEFYKVTALLTMGWRASMAHEDALAEKRFAAADVLASKPGLRAMVLNQRARAKADPHAALELRERGLVELRKAYGDSNPLVGRSHVEIANNKFQMGDLEGAEVAWNAAGVVYRGAFGDADTPIMADYLQMGGILAQWRHRPEEARRMLSRAVAVYADAGLTGLTYSQAQAERNLANLVASELDEPTQGEVHYRRALALMEQARGRESTDYADVEASLGIYLATDDCGAGASLLEHARSVLEPLRAPMAANVLAQLGDCMRTQGPDVAARDYQAALVLCRDRGCEPGTAERIEGRLGSLLAAQPATRARGLAIMRGALARLKHLGDDDGATEIETALARWK